MITPAYAPTATERVLPRLALDFTTAFLDGRVTVTRALNTATRVNSSGYIEIVNANLPRFDYDPVTNICRGLLIEESRINSMTYSGEIQTYWSPAFSTLSAFSSTAPDGTGTVCRMLPSNSANVHGAQRTLSTTGAVTFSIFAKSNGYNRLVISGNNTNYVYFNLDTGTRESSLGTNWTGATVTPAGNGWYRCSATTSTAMGRFDALAFNALQTNGNTGPSFTADGTSSILLWGAQVEAGAFTTSYIPTTSTSLTRNADDVSMTGTNFSSWYVSSSAALAAVVIPSIATGARPIWQLDDTTANEIIALRGNVANPELYIVDNGTPQAQLDAGTITANTQYGLCAAFTANSCAASQNGASPVTTATATIPTVTQARIGSDGSNFLNGAVRTLRYWPQRILNTEIQAFSR